MAWQPPEFRPDDLPVIQDAQTYEVLKRLVEQVPVALDAEFPGDPLPGFVARFLTSLRWRLREWENKQP